MTVSKSADDICLFLCYIGIVQRGKLLQFCRSFSYYDVGMSKNADDF